MNRYQAELYHYGIKGMKKGVRRGPPYPIGKKRSTSSKKSATIALAKSLAKPASKRPTFYVSHWEENHVLHKVMTHAQKELHTMKVFSKYIGDYIYTIDNNFDGTFRIIGKVPIVPLVFERYKKKKG